MIKIYSNIPNRKAYKKARWKRSYNRQIARLRKENPNEYLRPPWRMRWGVRRYQNDNGIFGTLTEEGKERYFRSARISNTVMDGKEVR